MSGEVQKKQPTRAGPTTAITDTNLARGKDQVGTTNTHRKGTDHFNSLRMGMTFACLKWATKERLP